MASSSRRGARHDAAASSASPRAAPVAGADLEALVRELLELERFTERRERMLSRTQTRQRERHERERHERERREARERLERLERRERRRRETRARRVETSRSRDAREDDRETRAATSSRRSRSAPLEPADRRDRRGRRDRHEREGARDEPAARRVSGASDSARASDSASSASRSATGASASSSASDRESFAVAHPAFAREDILATEIARLRRRVSRLARAESVTPREDGRDDDARARTSRSAPRPRRDASVSAFGLGGSTRAERFFDASFSSSRLADRRRRASAEGFFARHGPPRRYGSGVPPFQDEEDFAFGYDARFGEDARGSPTPSLRPDSAIDWETEREHLREFRVPGSEFRVPRHARGFGDAATPRFSTLGRFFDELRDLRRRGADGDEWFAARSGAQRAERPRGPWRDPRFASPLRSRQRSRDAGAEGAHAARADDTADERGASPPESGAASPGGAGDDRRAAEPEARDEGRARGAASVRAAPSSGDARVGDADAELSLLLSERPGFSEMLAGVLASMRSLPAADLREACVGVITGTPPRAPSPAAAARTASGRGSAHPGAAVGSLLGGDTSAHSASTSDSEFAYAAYASLEPPEAFPRVARAPAPAPVGAPWDGSDVPDTTAARAAPAATSPRGARDDARTTRAVSRFRAAGPESDEGGEIVTFSDLFGGVARRATSAPHATPAASSASAAAAADPLAAAPPPPPASVPTAADAAALVARHASAADTQAERGERASSPPPPPPPLAAGPGVRGSPRAGAAASRAASAAPGARGCFSTPADAADADSDALSVDGEAMARLLEREQSAQRDAEMSPFAEGAHDDGADLVDFASDAAAVAAASADNADAASRAALATEDRFDPPSAPETLDQAASRLPFSESLNATLLEALGSVVADAGGAAAEATAAAAAADAEALEARAKADARAAAAAAEIAAARAHSSASVSARVGRQNGEALAPRAQADGGSSPASASTTPDAPPSPGAKRRFKERLKMFNTPAS